MNHGKAIRLIRAARGITQKELARQSGLDPSYISLIENGDRAPSMATLKKIATVLRVPIYLLVLLGSDRGELKGISAKEAEALGAQLLNILVEADEKGR